MNISKEETPNKYLITAALPYANGPIHIGHLSGVYIPADIFTRYLRNKKKEVLFIGGSDEHGVPISIKAKKEGISPQEIVDKYHHIIKNSFENFGISYDIYSRTSSDIHHKTASDFFTHLYEKNKFIEKEDPQLFDEKANQFLPDRFVIGTCPKCHNEDAYGDQCEKCGTHYNSTDLIKPKSTITGNSPIIKKTNHWFLPLNEYESFLKEWILKGQKKNWKTNVYGQVKSWIDDGLQARAVTRDLHWGIPVPIKGQNSKVLYVWFEAPIGYISSTKEWAEKEGKNWESYWKDEDTALIQFIGKDNIVFHCIIFPIMLKAHGNYILPKNIPANEFLNLEGKKLSTSKNWAVWIDEYLCDFPNQQDTLRYVLTSIIPETKDSDFTWKDFQNRNNNELVAIFGNFVNRVLVLIHKYYEGIVPYPDRTLTNNDEITLKRMSQYPKLIGDAIYQYRFKEACQEMMNLSRLGNKYLADEEPWKVIKQNEERTKTILHISLQIVAALSTLCEPFLPFTAKKLKKLLNITPEDDITWDSISSRSTFLHPQHQINKPFHIFEKIEDDQIEKQLDKLKIQ